MTHVVVAIASRDENDRYLAQGGDLLQVVAKVETIDAGQINIEGDQIEIPVLCQFPSLTAGGGGDHAASAPFEQQHQCFQHFRVVFDDKNLRIHKLAQTTESQYCYAGVTIKTGDAGSVKFDFRTMPRKQYPANIVGAQIRRLRVKLGMTQEQFAAGCQLAGLDISRSTLGQIEARLRYVSDGELVVLASLLGVALDHLYPEEALKRYRIRKSKPKGGKSR